MPNETWKPYHLFDFIYALPDNERLLLMKGVELVDEKAGLDALQDKRTDTEKIEAKLLWISSNVLTYPISKLDYHYCVTWVANKAGIEASLVSKAPTFALEREILKSLFADIWDKLTPGQRQELLQKIDPNGQLQNKAALVAMTGAGVLAALSSTVVFSGFAFYSTMSVTISTVAGFVGLTLPFAAYSGASSLVAFLSGPVGWALLAVAATAGVAVAGRADVKKTTAFICQLHMLKVAALVEDGTPADAVFG